MKLFNFKTYILEAFLLQYRKKEASHGTIVAIRHGVGRRAGRSVSEEEGGRERERQAVEVQPTQPTKGEENRNWGRWGMVAQYEAEHSKLDRSKDKPWQGSHPPRFTAQLRRSDSRLGVRLSGYKPISQ